MIKRGTTARGVQLYQCQNATCATQRFVLERYRAPSRAAYMRRYRKRQRVKVYHRSQRDDWGTPPDLFAKLDAEFHFTLDVCASPATAKCARYFTREDDGLAQDWGSDVCFMNPPYGPQETARWIRKAYESAQHGATVVCLVKATPDTKWWHTYAPLAEVRYIPRRLRFDGAKDRAPFPSALLIFRPPPEARNGTTG